MFKFIHCADLHLGSAFSAWRKQRPEDMFKRTVDNKWVPNCDVFHLGDGGEYFQALVWAASLYGVDVTKCAYKPDFLDAARAEKMKACAMEAVKGK